MLVTCRCQERFSAYISNTLPPRLDSIRLTTCTKDICCNDRPEAGMDVHYIQELHTLPRVLSMLMSVTLKAMASYKKC